MSTSTYFRRSALPLVAILVFAAGCTSDDDPAGDTAGSGAPASDAPAGSTAGSEAPAGSAAPGDTVEEVQSSGSTLDAVQAAGTFNCGTRDDLPGFATLDPSGEHVGFDSDFCRVIAAAVLGDATAVEMVDVATDDRFTALQSGEIDALVRNTTLTATRDGAEGATFLQPTYYDGQGMMVAADSGFATTPTIASPTAAHLLAPTLLANPRNGNSRDDVQGPGTGAPRSRRVHVCGTRPALPFRAFWAIVLGACPTAPAGERPS